MIKRDESGYSMVEVLVAILILVLAIVPMFAMFDLGLRTATTNSQLDQARALAERQVELAQSQGKVPDIKSDTENGIRWVIEDPPQKLGFKDLDGGTVELCPTSSGDESCEAPAEGSGMTQMTVKVFRQTSPSSDPIFTTTRVITE